ALSSFLEYEAIFEADPWWRLYLGMRPYIGVNANLSMPKEGELMARVTEGLVGKIISKVLNYQVKLFEVKVQLAQAPPKQKPVLVDLEPKSVTMRPCTPTMFSASLEGATNERVTWHVSGGSITPD